MSSHERKNSGGNGRDGRGHDYDHGEPGDPTVVIVSDAYTRAAIGRLGDGLRDAAALCDRFREGGEAPSKLRVAILGELIERFVEIRMHAEGAERGVRRVEREQIAKLSKETP